MNLGEFIDTYKDAIAQRVVESYPPLYRPRNTMGTYPIYCGLPWEPRRTPSGAQPSPLQTHRGTTIVGEMGTGKTYIATAAAHMAGFQRILVLCPPHLTRKWKREVEETVPTARTAIVTSITDLENLRHSVDSGPLFAVMSRERAKLSYRWKPAVEHRLATSRGRLVRDEETGEPFRVPCCPVCTHPGLGQGRGAPKSQPDEPEKAYLLLLRLSPLAGRRFQFAALSIGGLCEAQDERFLRPAVG